jgi:DUF1365 family protein
MGAVLTFAAVAMSDARLLLLTANRFGFQPQRVALWIYWHAVVLLWKGVPFFG